MTNRQYSRCRVTAQSMWKKSVASIAGCLGVQEFPPRHVGAPLWCRGSLQRLEDPADRGRTNPVAELEQLALDPLVSPAVVLSGELLDEGGDLGADRRPSCPVGADPLAADQAAVAAQDGAGGG